MDSPEQLLFFMQQHPWLNYMMMIMVASRLVFKPLFAILGKYAELSINEDKNHWIARFMQTKWYKLIAFTLDLTLSVKLYNKEKGE